MDAALRPLPVQVAPAPKKGVGKGRGRRCAARPMAQAPAAGGEQILWASCSLPSSLSPLGAVAQPNAGLGLDGAKCMGRGDPLALGINAWCGRGSWACMCERASWACMCGAGSPCPCPTATPSPTTVPQPQNSQGAQALWSRQGQAHRQPRTERARRPQVHGGQRRLRYPSRPSLLHCPAVDSCCFFSVRATVTSGLVAAVANWRGGRMLCVGSSRGSKSCIRSWGEGRTALLHLSSYLAEAGLKGVFGRGSRHTLYQGLDLV